MFGAISGVLASRHVEPQDCLQLLSLKCLVEGLVPRSLRKVCSMDSFSGCEGKFNHWASAQDDQVG